ncbi:HET-domain-containing protein [Hypoxylon sp. FL1150]|nr:HET-domain-containing protein [Hypoxylon sp. FL1150]
MSPTQSRGLDPLMPFTSKAPHSCEHCSQITLDLRRGETAIDHSSAPQFRCGSREAIAADNDGCPLFRACLDEIRKEAHLDAGFIDRDGWTFTVRYEKEELPYLTASVVLSVSVAAKEKDNIYHTMRLRVWAYEDDPASADVTTRPCELNYNSPAIVDFARNCVKSCQSDHSECRRLANEENDTQGVELIDTKSIPSRLIHLFTKDSVLHVAIIGRDIASEIPKDDVTQRGFAILSYCWGGPQPVQLTYDSIGNLADGVPISCLPKTLRDAAWLTNEMGLEYLWIDALCILQDDPDDKIRELSRMELYYSHNTVTICAASAARCSDGFLSSREEDAADYSVGPIQLRCTTSTGASGTVQALILDDDFNQKRHLQPIATRGWTLQESLLSRRILIFSSRQLYFTCNVANASCGGLEPMLTPRVMTSYESRAVGIHTFSGLRSYPLRTIWKVVVQEYSKRYLGFATDKLPAVAAMASRLSNMARERSQELWYLAGLMLDSSELESYAWCAEFLWVVTQTEETKHVPGRGPSWSWSSVDGAVLGWAWGWPGPYDLTSTDEQRSDEQRLCQYGIELENRLAPFGTVREGFVKIYTRTRNINSIGGFNYVVSTERHHENQRMDSGKTILVLSPDTRERTQIVRKGIQEKGDVLLVELIPFYKKAVSPAGLIVTRILGTDCYVRIGMFEFQKPDNVPVETAETETGIASRKSLFDSLPFHEICIT